MALWRPGLGLRICYRRYHFLRPAFNFALGERVVGRSLDLGHRAALELHEVLGGWLVCVWELGEDPLGRVPALHAERALGSNPDETESDQFVDRARRGVDAPDVDRLRRIPNGEEQGPVVQSVVAPVEGNQHRLGGRGKRLVGLAVEKPPMKANMRRAMLRPAGLVDFAPGLSHVEVPALALARNHPLM